MTYLERQKFDENADLGLFTPYFKFNDSEQALFSKVRSYGKEDICVSLTAYQRDRGINLDMKVLTSKIHLVRDCMKFVKQYNRMNKTRPQLESAWKSRQLDRLSKSPLFSELKDLTFAQIALNN